MAKTLREVIKSRKTVRKFDGRIPEEKDIEEIIEAGIYAPYGGATGIPLKELRKFFIFKHGTPAIEEAERLIVSNIKKGYKKISLLLSVLPFLKKKAGTFASRLKIMSENGIPALSECGYFIVIAEKKGFPPVEKQSMAHALENMWLTAEDKGLAFQLLSAAGQMSKNKDFLNLLGLKKGAYEIEGCIVGFAGGSSPKTTTYDAGNFIKWM